MSNLQKIQDHLRSVNSAVDNVVFGRMPLEHLEKSFALHTEYIQSLLDSERYNQEKEK